ncbi:uncharacterized protein LOC126762422 [Bactrocera neohumeralis]|uniref:uncharacterized protein LOC126762422 n=1 Tax=Bactrocera neohumeralis TaxID=98809 RepID=UPI002165FE19|nr:uncharacterized protein LOC126762422 [Bactrocera neohumeralis]
MLLPKVTKSCTCVRHTSKNNCYTEDDKMTLNTRNEDTHIELFNTLNQASSSILKILCYVNHHVELDKMADKGNARKFYERMRRLTEGFKTGAYSCRTPKGDLVTDVQSILKLWKEHLSSLLNGSESITPREGEPDYPIDHDGADVPLPEHEEV